MRELRSSLTVAKITIAFQIAESKGNVRQRGLGLK